MLPVNRHEQCSVRCLGHSSSVRLRCRQRATPRAQKCPPVGSNSGSEISFTCCSARQLEKLRSGALRRHRSCVRITPGAPGRSTTYGNPISTIALSGTNRVPIEVVSSLDRSPNGRLQIERPSSRIGVVRRLVRTSAPSQALFRYSQGSGELRIGTQGQHSESRLAAHDASARTLDGRQALGTLPR
jgi:hypothetical protein